MTLHASYKRRLRIFAKSSEKSSAASSGSNSHFGIDRVSSLASQWAQVLTLALVAFGYFYTVRPVYQKEVLEEESAKLKIENSQTKREVRLAAQRVAAIRHEMQRLELEKTNLLQESHAFKEQNKNLSAQKLLIENAAKAAGIKLSSLEKLTDAQIETAQTNLLLNTFSLHFWGEIDAIRRPFLDEKTETLEAWFKSEQIQPAEVIVQRIDKELRDQTYFGLPQPHSISKRIIERIRSGVIAHRAELTCPTIDRKSWSKAWQEAGAIYDRSINDCAEFHLQHTIKSEGWNAKQASGWLNGAQGEAYKQSFLASCEVSAGFRKAKLFDERLTQYDSACRARLIYADNIALGKKVDLDQFPSLLPPSPEPRWFEDWYKTDKAD